jgi:exonuclease-1
LTGIADFIISEDSDLAPFGCDKILFKMDITGNGTLVSVVTPDKPLVISLK